MKKALILGGTTEGRILLQMGIPCIYTAATAYGGELAQQIHAPHAQILTGRLDEERMLELLTSEPIACLLDATHPYAAEVSKNAQSAAQRKGVPYIRVLRAETEAGEGIVFSGHEEAAEWLQQKTGNILLTIGSKEMEPYLRQGLKERCFFRILPAQESFLRCAGLGISPDRVIAMRGPFSQELNTAMMRQIDAKYLVTKDSGAEGGFLEKQRAAEQAGVEVIRILRPVRETGVDTATAGAMAMELLGVETPQVPRFPLWVDVSGRQALVVGCGPVARRRAETLIACGATVRMVSPEGQGVDGAELIRRCYEPEDLRGAFLAVAATNDAAVNGRIAAEAKARGIWVSVADNAGGGTFHFPSLVADGRVAVSVSTGGTDPALARKLSDRLRALWRDWVREAGQEDKV